MPADSLQLTDSILKNGLTLGSVALCALCAIIAGLAIAELHKRNGECTASFLVTLATLPLLVQTVIMVVNGNLGAGVAVAGAFSLVRFRSLPGGAREITGIFCAMALGLVVGMGYLLYAMLFLVVIAAFHLILQATRFGEKTNHARILKLTIPENLDYEDAFDDVFAEHVRKNEMLKVKTTNMGSLFELTYRVWLKDGASSKAFLDTLRTRNISLSRELASDDTL